MRAVKCEAHDGRETRGVYGIAQPSDVFRGRPNADAGSEHIRGQLCDALHRRGATGDHYSAVQSLRKARSLNLTYDEIEDLVHALMDDMRQHFTRNVPFPLRHGAG